MKTLVLVLGILILLSFESESSLPKSAVVEIVYRFSGDANGIPVTINDDGVGTYGEEFITKLTLKIDKGSRKVIEARFERGPDFVVISRDERLGTLPVLTWGIPVFEIETISHGYDRNRFVILSKLEAIPKPKSCYVSVT